MYEYEDNKSEIDEDDVELSNYVRYVEHMCAEGIYEPLIFLKNPHIFHGSVVFGENEGNKKCPKDKSRIDMTVIYGTDSHAMEIYEERKLEVDGVCPRELLRFDPPPNLSFCQSNAYRPITCIAELTTRLKFSNMPPPFNSLAQRVERVVSVFSSLDHMPNLKDELNITLKAPYNNPDFQLSINDEDFVLPNFNKYFEIADHFDDVKFESSNYWTHYYGFERMCSLIAANLTTFDDVVLNVTETLKDNCWMLLAADCSDQSRLSVFIKPKPSDGSFAVKVYVGDDVVEYDPQDNAEQILIVNNENKVKLNAMDTKEINFLSTLTPIKISFNEQHLLVLESEYSLTVQYNLNDMLTLSVLSFYKGQICGLCAAEPIEVSNFNLCV